ncbi:MAG: NAD(P)/FAD-dependent oxidoreductase [Acidobacteria bacterium]|nr:MAG: NAD(P)/FAD-dependent oxidoreductase [Acidobacteriota bacterium]REK02417.1 MAG: NAD(P)/FAD-dependent oxidoreductase [Acidobacteriota bacterium]REK13782.1 MAG: NAD(P)/FAD-dependent oxidoreductase [Acidobacteriota bacterium]REK41776.1 MAG: NAD(P)/FAD-dependent oxidoreductase [Acidobacteriota bacterium]
MYDLASNRSQTAWRSKPVAKKKTEILVIGGGPAGLAAAEAASSHGKQVTVIDENPAFGGQIWRAEKSELSEKAKNLVEALEKNGVEMIASCTCVASLPDKRILALSNGKTFPIRYDKVIIATGAREQFVPFPGWTLPGVFGAGGLQALVKGGYDISGKRIVVAGTGPLLLAVAAYLKKKGGNVILIAERTDLLSLIGFGLSALRVPGKWREALELRKEIRGISYMTSSSVLWADGNGKLSRVTITNDNEESEIECDLLAIGWHLVPNLEVPTLFGCDLLACAVNADEYMRTSVEDVLSAGEINFVGGLELSLIEGKIAGHSAAENLEAARGLLAKRSRLLTFASSMLNTFLTDPEELRKAVTNDTIVCRCEDVPYGRVKDLKGFNEAKLETRLGMGQCQGRVCGSACEVLFGWEANSVRPPLVPLKISELANFETENK